MKLRAFVWASFFFLAACSAKPKETAKESPAPAASKTSTIEEKPQALRPLPPPEPPVPAVDPSRVAVEEDFVAEAAQRITKRNNLELELERLAKEIESAPR